MSRVAFDRPETVRAVAHLLWDAAGRPRDPGDRFWLAAETRVAGWLAYSTAGAVGSPPRHARPHPPRPTP